MEWRERTAAWAATAAGATAMGTGDDWWWGIAAVIALAGALWCAVTRDEDWTVLEDDDDSDLPPEDRPSWGTR